MQGIPIVVAVAAFSLMHAVSLNGCGVDGSPRLFVDNSAEAAQH